MILLTGFEPFGGENINPSKELLGFYFSDPRIQTLCLPVSYRRSFDLVMNKLRSQSFQHILMLGQAGGRKTVCLERIKLNLRDAEMPDSDGYQYTGQKIDPSGSDLIWSSYDLDRWVSQAKVLGLPLSVSNSAGAYVCNSLSYQVGQATTVPSLFVHVPYLPLQTQNKNEPSMELIQMKSCLDFIINQLST